MQTLINLAVAFVIISWAIMAIGQMLLLWTEPSNDKELLSKLRLMALPIWARLLVVLISPVVIIWHNLLVSVIITAVAAYCCL